MRYLITGGAGFVGSHLADALLDAGHSVTIIDDLSTGEMDNIVHLKDRPGFEYVIDSVLNESLLAELIDLSDTVCHLAAAVGVELIVTKPVETIEINIAGTELVLKHADKKKKRVLITSTSEVYGKKEEVPYKETDDLLLGPTTKSRWCYACSKAVDEFLALAYQREKKVPVIIARLFNTVGPRQVGRYGMVIPRFVNQALDGGPITVYGDGTQSRCFAYVGDVVRGLTALVESDAAVGQVFNVGNNEEISILALAEKVREMVDPSIEIKTVPYSEAYGEGFEDLKRRVPDLSKINKVTGYEPTVDIDGILTKVIDHERKKR